jgi:hypothetical protein
MAPLLAAALWESERATDHFASLARIDVEAIFLLSLPLIETSSELSGNCRLTVEVPNGKKRVPVGVTCELRGGAIASCRSRLEGHAEVWVSGSRSQWLRALVQSDPSELNIGGDGALARELVEGLHAALFKANRPRYPQPKPPEVAVIQ